MELWITKKEKKNKMVGIGKEMEEENKDINQAHEEEQW